MIITGDEWRLIQEISGDYYGGLMVINTGDEW